MSYEHDIRAAVRKVGETVGLLSLRVPQSVADHHLPTILQRFCAEYPRMGFDLPIAARTTCRRNCGAARSTPDSCWP